MLIFVLHPVVLMIDPFINIGVHIEINFLLSEPLRWI